MEVCRDRYGFYPVETFKLLTCSMCYSYLFKGDREFSPNWPRTHELVYHRSRGSHFPAGTVFRPNIENVTVARAICQTLTDVDCQRWTLCCQKAISCCDRQMSHPHTDPLATHCPRTWDGFGCFDDTLPGMTAAIACPLYIDQSNPEAVAYKECSENATWWTDPKTGQEWTDYTTCVHMQGFKTLYYVGLSCNVISLALLLPACIIFLAYRQMRKQHRIQIHLNLFLSFVITNVAMIMWENIVYKDRLDNAADTALMYRDTVGCKLLYVMTRYAWTSNFCWMFLEGFHLYRLIVRAFKVPRSIVSYFVAGWMISVIPIVVYAVIRMLRADEGCWVQNAGHFEWIIYIPNLMCIVLNIFFLVGILRILLTTLQTHPNEPSNYRRALKATCVLVPVFGLQLFLVIYRPNAESSTTIAYEMFSKVVICSQGAVVALIFCYFNGEVSSHLKGLFLSQNLLQSDSPHSGIARTYSNTTNYDIGSNGHSPAWSRQESLIKNGGSKPDKREYIHMRSSTPKKGRLNYNQQV